jgi:hypothetical protein
MVNVTNIPDLLVGILTTLNASLPQNETNGLSTYGTLGATKFSKFLTNNPMPDGYPWGEFLKSLHQPMRLTLSQVRLMRQMPIHIPKHRPLVLCGLMIGLSAV